MALKKNIVLANGASGEYWKITNISIDKKKLSASFTISLFKDQEHADNDSPPIGPSYSANEIFSKELLAGDVTALGYELIKSKVSNYDASKHNIFGLQNDKNIHDNLVDSEDV